MACTNSERLTWQDFDEAASALAEWIIARTTPRSGPTCRGGPTDSLSIHPDVPILGIARGGLPLAVALSHRTKRSLILNRIDKPMIVVDDIADSGVTLLPFSNAFNVILTWCYHPRSVVLPHIWMRRKGRAWIVFPWEE
jgi:hypoxanthine phosphoribosyltransferase